MLIWLNGPFGGGKTQTAHELCRRLPGSVISDPEHAGFGLRRMLPKDLRGNFQDLHAWRAGVVEVLDLVLRKNNGPVIVPMTVLNPRYFDETVGRLREMNHEVRHFALLAHREVVLRRLRERGIGHALQFAAGKNTKPRKESWAVSMVDECLATLRKPEFAEHVWTDNLTVKETADHIATSTGLPLTPNTDSRPRAYLRRAWTSAKHIRFD
jgi:hypothetical protein